MNKKAMIAMSGGVDSSVTALLMMEAGYKCTGVTMHLMAGKDEEQRDASRVCERLGIPHRVLDLSEPFEKKIIGRFIDAYQRGETPNPCVDCNRFLKFGRLFEEMEDGSVMATGHYARVQKQEGKILLLKAADESKDQSYVLYSLTQRQLERIHFPLGDKSKEEIRALAAAHGLENAQKKDSQDICFVPDGDYAGYIERYIDEVFRPGPIMDESGRILGEHRGLIRYTIGQRRGLGIASEGRLYVKTLDTDRNAVVLGGNPSLYSQTLEAVRFNLIAGGRLERPVRLGAKIRYRHAEQPATAEQIDEDRVRVTFDTPQRAITPGQSVVLYDGDVVVGGGVIMGK